MIVIRLETSDLIMNLAHLALGPLDGGGLAALTLPAIHVALHLFVAAHLLCNVMAELADIVVGLGLVDELESASLAHAVLFVALLAEVAPAPVAALPAGLVEVAHDLYVYYIVFRFSWFRRPEGQLRSGSGRDTGR